MPAQGDAQTVLDVVRGVVTEVSDGRGLGLVTLDVSLERELGLGSLERVELFGRVERAFDVRFTQEVVASVDTPRQLLALIRAQRGGDAAEPERTGASGVALLPKEPPAPEPADATTLVEVLEYHARHQPDRVHVILRGEDGSEDPVTYGELHRLAQSVAAALRARGLERAGTVAIMLPTGRAYFASFLGSLLAGGVPVPLYPPFRLDRIAEYVEREALILDNAQSRILITFDRAARVADIARDRVSAVKHVLSIEEVLGPAGKERPAPEVSAVAADVTAEDTALIQYTSGSTGDPKGVELTHSNVISNIRAARHGCALAPGDVVVSWLPLYHDMGLIGGWLMSLYFGTPCVLMSPLTFLARPESWLQALSEYEASCSVAPNFAFDLCVKRIDDEAIARLDLRRVRALLNGSEPILPVTLDRFARRFAPAGLRRETLFCAYGLAENMVAVTFPPVLRAPLVDRIRRVTFETEGRAEPVDDGETEDVLEFVGVGSPVLHHEVRIVDERGEPLPDRRQGQIHFRGPSTFKGYYRRPEATAKVKLEGGWVDSGDLGYTVDGELFITGRVKDVIIKGGRNYYPHEIEAAAGGVKGIRMGCVAAFSVRDDDAGTEAIVVIAETREKDEMTRETLIQKLSEAVVAKVGVPPDRVMLTRPGSVPKTSSGKIRRTEARRLYTSGEITRGHGSFARQAAGLYLRSVPGRAAELARRVGRTLYGGYTIGAWMTFIGSGPLVGRLVRPGRPARKLAAAESRAALRMAGMRPRVIGMDKIPRGAAVLVANHCGYMDFIICMATMPIDTRFVIKGELRNNKLYGPVLRRSGHVFIDRHSAARSLSDLEEVLALLRDDQRVLLFPEGTFYPEIGMRQFKLGAFRLACDAGVPVVPVAIRGSRKALRDGTWLPRRVSIEVEVLDPIEPNGRELADIVRLRDQAAEAIAAHIDEPRLHAVDISVPGSSR